MHPRPPTRITLQDVAAAAGVSVSTASRSFNGQAAAYRISEETANRVCEVARKLGFQASRVAQSLRSQCSGLIGMVVPDISNPFFSSIAREVTLAAESEGFSVLLADSQENTEREVKLLAELRSRQVEALVVCPVGVEGQHLRDLHDSGLPLVLVDRTFPDADFVQVTSRHCGGAQRATRMLTQQGHRRIGVLQGLPGTLPNTWRLDGVREALQAAGVGFDPQLVAGDNFTESSGYRSATMLLSDNPDLTALFAFSAPIAFGVLRAVKEAGRSVPEDLSVVSFDDSPFAEFMQVPLSTVAQDVTELGRCAADLVMKRLKTGRKPRKKLHQIDVRILERCSIREVSQ